MDKAAIYCRLSKEDHIKINQGDDSESIQNQKMLLLDYAVDNNMQIYKVYSDDDYSGADKNRPEWNKMLTDAKKNEFNIILCKTQSRFTREMEVVEKYIHGLFLEWGIRFIGVVDNVDTNNKGNKKARQINGLVNEWYLEDISENIKSVFRQKMKDGKFLGSFACYGYQKDPNDKYKIIIDEEATNVVRKIFKLYIQGYSIKEIAKTLTEEKVLTPTQYKESLGLSYHNSQANTMSARYGLWSISTVKRILNNKSYIGYLIQGREKKVSYKSKKVVIAPEEDWIVIENNHEPIIDTSTFYQVQHLLKAKRTVSIIKGDKKKSHCLSTKGKCKECGSSLVKSGGNPYGKSYLRCRLANITNNIECTSHSIRLDLLIDEVSKQIHSLIEYAINQDTSKSLIEKVILGRFDNKKRLSIKLQEEKLINAEIEEISKTFSKLYIDKVKGIVNEELFSELSKKFDEDLKHLNAVLVNLKKEIKVASEELSIKVDYISLARKYLDFEVLSNDIVTEFIDYIEVGEKNANGEREIDIHWLV